VCLVCMMAVMHAAAGTDLPSPESWLLLPPAEYQVRVVCTGAPRPAVAQPPVSCGVLAP